MLMFFFFNDTATTEIYTLSLHDALPISDLAVQAEVRRLAEEFMERHDRLDVLVNNAGLVQSTRTETRDGIETTLAVNHLADRKSTRLNSSHANISYAVFCLKKKKTDNTH